MTENNHLSKTTSGLIGVSATGAGLAAGEMVASFSTQISSPVENVGNRFIDVVPAPIKDLAIALFGGSDKFVLIIGILVVVTFFSYRVGVWAYYKNNVQLAYAAIAAFGIVGIIAAVFTRSGTKYLNALPVILTTIVTLGVIYFFKYKQQKISETDAGQTVLARRNLITIAIYGAIGSFAVFSISNIFNRFSTREFDATISKILLPEAKNPLPEIADDTQAKDATPFITPTDDFYRIDINLTIPKIPIEDWQLRVHGMVDKEIVLTYDDLIKREIIEADITLNCVSNEIGGNLIGNARWTGIRLDTLLEEAGIDPKADQIVGRSTDGFTAGFPVSSLDGRDSIIAIGMNGEPLSASHGFPARLVVPGIYGYTSATKWLTEIELTTFASFDQYWVPRGWDAIAPIKLQSRIDTPKALETIGNSDTVIAGVAWAQTIGIEKVEIKIEEVVENQENQNPEDAKNTEDANSSNVDKDLWQEAELASEHNLDTWRQWSYAWEKPKTGRYVITARATDKNGQVQTETVSEPPPNGASGHHRIPILVESI